MLRLARPPKVQPSLRVGENPVETPVVYLHKSPYFADLLYKSRGSEKAI